MKAFTLIEVLIVVAIVAILGAVVFGSCGHKTHTAQPGVKSTL